MAVQSGTKRLLDLLMYLHELTGLHFSLHSLNGGELFAGHARGAFCDLVCGAPGGYERCLTCDRNAVEVVGKTAAPYQYRCHAGLIDIAIPVFDAGQLAAVIQFGQILDDGPLDAQAKEMRRLTAWCDRREALDRAFMQLPRFSEKKIRACLEIVNACVCEVRLEGLFAAREQSDEQRLVTYINAFYAHHLRLDDIAKALALSKSKLCAVAARVSPGMTVGKLLTKRRIEMARVLLAQTDAPVRDVAEQVGIDDYNYFSKVFRALSGQTPTQYRKNGALDSD